MLVDLLRRQPLLSFYVLAYVGLPGVAAAASKSHFWSKVVSDGERLRALAGGVFVEYCQFCIRKVAGMDGNQTHLGPVIGPHGRF
jgi:hypothetical protein